ncbi:MAG: T9SS type A sorting domain-containing protein [bacterium]
MKKLSPVWAVGPFLVVSVFPLHRLAAQANAPQSLRSDIQVQHFLNVEREPIRIDQDRSSGLLYYVLINGDIYQVDLNGTSKSRVQTAADHGISSVAGFVISSKGDFFLVGNLTQGNNNVGIVKKGEIINNQRVWSTLARTVPYPLNRAFNHNFNAIAISRSGDSLLVNSGARTDHGESQYDSGPLAGLREIPLTTKIFRIPIGGQDIVLENNEAYLKNNGYLYAQGVRNTFDLAFAPNGDLFGPENSGDRDDSEELNWIRPDHHYGFPWRMGTNNTPQQFPGYDPNDDPLVDPSAYAYGLGFFHDDPTYPSPPAGVVFTDAVPSIGPDADKFRDPDDGNGTIKDASDLGITISTFTSHRSPLGLVFDVDSVLAPEFAGDGFLLSNSSIGSSVLGDPSQDLLHLKLTKIENEQRYVARVTRLVQGFNGAVDAVMVGNKIYALEYSGRNVWAITLPAAPTSVQNNVDRPENFHLAQSYPNPFNPSTNIQFELDAPGTASLKIYDLDGRLIQVILSHAPKSSGSHQIAVDMSGYGSGVYFYVLEFGNRKLAKKMTYLR